MNRKAGACQPREAARLPVEVLNAVFRAPFGGRAQIADVRDVTV